MNNIAKDSIGVPKIPKKKEPIVKVEPPITRSNKKYYNEPESLMEFILLFLGNGIKLLPKLLPKIILPIAIASILNLIIMTIPTYSVSGFIKSILMLIVFITASYNGFFARTIFWIIIFTIGKKIFFRIKNYGFPKVQDDFSKYILLFKNTWSHAKNNASYFLLIGIGLGFISANFLSRNNKIDKISIYFVIAISIIDTLLKENNKLFLFIKLVNKEICKLSKKTSNLNNNHAFLISSGFAIGLLSNTIFALLRFDYGGYIVGLIIIVGLFVNKISHKYKT